MRMTFIDFFAGIGGFHSGFEKAGMKCIGWCEFDKYAQKSYRAIDQYEKAASVNSKSQLYKQAGNAVTVNVTYEIGKHIIGFEKNDGGEK